MKTLKQYIIEADDENAGKLTSNVSRGDIKFTIWTSPDNKTTELKNNEAYQKIEYKLIDKTDNIEIDFLLGYQDESWKIWIGKIGSCSYDDDPFKSFNTDNFKKAIVMALTEIEDFVAKVKEDPQDYIQYYKNS